MPNGYGLYHPRGPSNSEQSAARGLPPPGRALGTAALTRDPAPGRRRRPPLVSSHLHGTGQPQLHRRARLDRVRARRLPHTHSLDSQPPRTAPTANRPRDLLHLTNHSRSTGMTCRRTPASRRQARSNCHRRSRGLRTSFSARRGTPRLANRTALVCAETRTRRRHPAVAASPCFGHRGGWFEDA